MATIINLTPGPVQIGLPAGGGFLQRLREVPDILAFSIITFEIEALSWETPGASPAVTILIYSSLQGEGDQDQTQRITANLTLANPISTQTLDGSIFRYVRYIVLSSGWGTQTSVTFSIRGMCSTRESTP